MRKVAIVGAGWAGLACALAAASAGAEVAVYEQQPSPSASPMHVAVEPNMVRELASLGLIDACVQAGFPYRSFAISSGFGSLRLEIPYRRLAGDRNPAALGLQQQALSGLLARAAAERGVPIHRGRAVHGLRFEGDAIALELDDGQATPAADLTLLATGAEASLRDRYFPAPTQHGPTRSIWWTSVLRRPAGLDQLTWLAARQGRALLVPVNPLLAGLALIAPELDDVLADAVQSGSAAQPLRQWLATQPQALAALAPRVADDAPVQALPVRSALLGAPWHRGSLLCVGDAAHLLPPHLAQSGPQAFEDAVVFGELLRGHREPASLLDAYAKRRVPRVRAVFDLALRAARWDRGVNAQTDIPATVAALAAVVAAPA